jgi:hypothetical protein
MRGLEGRHIVRSSPKWTRQGSQKCARHMRVCVRSWGTHGDGSNSLSTVHLSHPLSPPFPLYLLDVPPPPPRASVSSTCAAYHDSSSSSTLCFCHIGHSTAHNAHSTPRFACAHVSMCRPVCHWFQLEQHTGLSHTGDRTALCTCISALPPHPTAVSAACCPQPLSSCAAHHDFGFSSTHGFRHTGKSTPHCAHSPSHPLCLTPCHHAQTSSPLTLALAAPWASATLAGAVYTCRDT